MHLLVPAALIGLGAFLGACSMALVASQPPHRFDCVQCGKSIQVEKVTCPACVTKGPVVIAAGAGAVGSIDGTDKYVPAVVAVD